MEEIQIDSNSFTPLYEQIRLKLMDQIASGTWDDGSPLPSEQKLAETFGVSRITVRQAISEIVRSGYLYRKQGKGTFVRTRDAYYLQGGTHNFLKNAEVLGRQARTDVLASEWKAADEAAASRLNIPPGEKYLFIQLLRTLDEEVVGWQIIDLPAEIGNLVDMDSLMEKQALNPLLQLKGARVAETHVVQGARLAAEADTRLLGCPPGSPILYSEYREFGADGKVLAFSEIAFRADRFRWEFKVVGA